MRYPADRQRQATGRFPGNDGARPPCVIPRPTSSPLAMMRCFRHIDERQPMFIPNHDGQDRVPAVLAVALSTTNLLIDGSGSAVGGG